MTQADPIVGTTVTATMQVFNTAGVLTDPATAIFRTKSGVSNTVTQYTFDIAGGTGDPTGTITHPGVGLLNATFKGTEHGTWHLELETTGSVVLVKESSVTFEQSQFSTA